MKNFIYILIFISSIVVAEESYTTYTKIGFGYIIDQPSKVTSATTKETYTPLYEDSFLSYHIEKGISVQNYKIGAYWTDFLNQKDKEVHRPYKFEIFIDNYIPLGSVDFKIGVGFKLAYQPVIYFEKDGSSRKIDTSSNVLEDRLTARIAFHKQYKNYVFSLDHHSHYLKGIPFDDDWEYHRTELNVAYLF